MKDGVVFTPLHIVEKMVRDIGDFTNKKVLEPSCGEGNFVFYLKDVCENFIAYDINEEFVNKNKEKFPEHKEKFFVKDFLTDENYEKFDCIIGNPPYVRIQDLNKEISLFLKEKYSFCSYGNFDLFYAFIEKSLQLLKDDGILSFIVPNSWMTSLAAKEMRKEIIKYEVKVEDFCSEKIFDKGTYVCILTIKKIKSNNDIEIKKNGAINYLEKKDILNGEIWVPRNTLAGNVLEIKNGIATLNDRAFIFTDFTENVYYSRILRREIEIEETIIRTAVKASTGEHHKCIYPYNKNGEPVTEDKLQIEFPLCYKYFKQIEPELKKRDYDNEWFLYGRSQSIKIQYGPKLVISPVLNKKGFSFFYEEDPSVIVYSGFFIKTTEPEKFTNLLLDEKLINFVLNYGRKMSGGWVSFSKKILDCFF